MRDTRRHNKISDKIADDIKLYLKSGGKIQKIKHGESAHDAAKYVKRDFVIDSRNYVPLEKKNEKLPRLPRVANKE
jgi:hypothetical protein